MSTGKRLCYTSVMIKGEKSNGYTIVEALFFLAISTFLMVMIYGVVAAQQSKTKFTQAVYEMESQIKDMMNDISTGYYAAPNRLKCVANPAASTTPTVTWWPPPFPELGTNKDCIFIGKVIQFEHAPGVYVDYLVAGRRLNPDGSEVTSIAEAHPIAFNHYTLDRKVPGSMAVAYVKYWNDVTAVPVDAYAFGFFTQFGKYNNLALSSGILGVSLIPIPNTPPPPPYPDIPNLIKTDLASVPVSTRGSIKIGFKRTGGRLQCGVITIGGNGRSLTTDVEILEGACVTPS